MRIFVQSLAAKKNVSSNEDILIFVPILFSILAPAHQTRTHLSTFPFPIFLSRPRTAFSSWRREAPGLFTVLPSLSRGTHMLRFFSLQIGDLPVCTNKWIMLDSAPFLTLFFFYRKYTCRADDTC